MTERKRVDAFKVRHQGTGTVHDVFVYELRIGDKPAQTFETRSGKALVRISENQFEMPDTKARFTRI
ncbi:hypothetical protein [Cupriavidus malaysiensis]|uniref:Uncharacterized protein n=1 Tax=Cupriavidus malaysiensis TaxID=367825 RepID=A0ABM6F5S6_9BURK|nr:hypothetical protein [Cupriavidus malaysiensis]AOZ06718.1 hypothetical protein BKK80_13515 [Cupriavidus malaysiensis]